MSVRTIAVTRKYVITNNQMADILTKNIRSITNFRGLQALLVYCLLELKTESYKKRQKKKKEKKKCLTVQYGENMTSTIIHNSVLVAIIARLGGCNTRYTYDLVVLSSSAFNR